MSNSSLFEPGQPLHVRLYGRPDCKLCNEAAQVLNALHSSFDFWVEKINIDDDPAIKEKLHELIPVVTFNGGNRVVVPVTDEKLRRAFKKALRLEDSGRDGAAPEEIAGWKDAIGALQPERRAERQERQPERRTESAA